VVDVRTTNESSKSSNHCEVALALRQQVDETRRLAERFESVEQICNRSIRSSAPVAGNQPNAFLAPEQVERLSAAVATRVTEANAPAPPAEPTPENFAAEEQANQRVSAAIGAKHWTQADQAQLRLLIPQLTDEQRSELTHRIVIAINRQEMTLDVRGPIF